MPSWAYSAAFERLTTPFLRRLGSVASHWKEFHLVAEPVVRNSRRA